ncbi:glycosyltransferase family 4 protein [Patescibacteria group bacterium]|nr:glycosyltransferase family 4 protein [Patescibacteria group bacterium]MBU1563748.1 glycosyltransferase family 4 protein [Patescibacteria group bacterium]
MIKRKQIRIGIDARFYGPKQKGLGRYVQKLVENLEKVDIRAIRWPNAFGHRIAEYRFIIFLRRENWNEYQPSNSNFKKVLADYPWYSLQEQFFMPFKIRQQKVDLMHFPHFNVPIFYNQPFVITIHDLILKKFPTRRASTLGPIRYWLKNLAYDSVIKSAIKRAKKIIAVSKYTKEDILKYFDVESDKIKVIYEGSPKPNIRAIRRLNVFGHRMAEYSPYLLYVGNAYPHKNLERLISTFKGLVKEKKNLKLVLVGELDYFYQRLQKISPAQVVFTDFVSDQELVKLYQNASLYVFPSLCEGFGLPPLEAMTYNLPVVCSKNSCLPEILGQAAIYFDPENTDDMVDKIKKVLDNKKLQKKLIFQGKETIKKYSWHKMAKETLEVYKSNL